MTFRDKILFLFCIVLLWGLFQFLGMVSAQATYTIPGYEDFFEDDIDDKQYRR